MRRQPASVVLTVASRKVSTGPPRAISSACFRRSAMICVGIVAAFQAADAGVVDEDVEAGRRAS